jgi:hypothetical protein
MEYIWAHIPYPVKVQVVMATKTTATAIPVAPTQAISFTNSRAITEAQGVLWKTWSRFVFTTLAKETSEVQVFH